MTSKPTTIERPPAVAIMGHVDHGKSTLLDYIRKTNIVDSEAGGITQHLSAYEVIHKNEGTDKKITFIDTPGHAAFSGMRKRGAQIADIAILIVSAEDGVKMQTVEAIQTILDSKTPYLVAINKIDKPNADPEKVKMGLMEHSVFLEGYGGDVPYVEISAKAGTNVSELLDTILLVAELEGFTGDPSVAAEGFIIESRQDEKRGTTAVLIIKNGTLKQGDFVVSGNVFSSTRIFENFLGKPLASATFSAPVQITGFSTLPPVGEMFTTVETKKEAEKLSLELVDDSRSPEKALRLSDETKVIPIILKTDVIGMIEAVEGEINNLSNDDVHFKIIKRGAGDISESDVTVALSDPETIILGFNVVEDKRIREINDVDSVTIKTFSIIYKLSEWLAEEQERRRPRRESEDTLGRMKVLAQFSSQKKNHVCGGRMESGTLTVKDRIKLIRGDETISYGRILGIQQAKSSVTKISDGEFGLEIEMAEQPQTGDFLEAFEKVIK